MGTILLALLHIFLGVWPLFFVTCDNTPTYVELVMNICTLELANPLTKRTCIWVDLGWI